jgi:hypothetical protein
MRPRTWQSCSTPSRLLDFLSGRITARKLRLFACACCRSVWHLIQETDSRNAVLTSEQYADDRAKLEDLLELRRRADAAATLAWELWDDGTPAALDAAAAAASEDPLMAANLASDYAARAAQVDADDDQTAWKNEQRRQCCFLRDLVGDPWHCPSRIDQFLLDWGSGTVLRMAKSVYDDRHFEDLAILADALEEAGCQDAEILAHCRGPGLHVRGCWVVDLILSKDR